MNWQSKVEAFCKEFSIPIDYLAETLNEPKVIPMIRGKAFEFTVLEKLKAVLNPEIWRVSKSYMNAQLGTHDEDVSVLHIPTNTNISIECKLAAKGGFRATGDGYEIKVKCMRSRTLGEAMVQRLSAQWGMEESVLQIHNDQYRPTDFDIVITSIGNAFYQTHPETDNFYWSPGHSGIEFLRMMFGVAGDTVKELAFNKMYIITSSDLTIRNGGHQTCTRRKCNNQSDCGFIPNYPIIKFGKLTNNAPSEPTNGWRLITTADRALLEVVAKKTGRVVQ